MSERTIAVIPARAGSKRVPRKNLAPVLGQPLIVWSIRAAMAARAAGAVDEVIVSTDDPEAAALATAGGALVYDRPLDLAGDHATTIDVLRQVSDRYASDTGLPVGLVVLLQATSPLREAGLIEEGVRRVREDPDATSLQAVFPVRHFTGRIVAGYWVGDFPETTRSQDLPTLYVPSGALYVYRYPKTIALGNAWGERVIPVIQDPELVVNIDEEADLVRLSEFAARLPKTFSYLLD